MLNQDGDYKVYDWLTAPPKNIGEPKNSNIQLINYTGEYDPFTIGTKFESTNVYGGELTPYAVFCTWIHWPTAQMPSNGRYTSFPDRAAHSSFTHAPVLINLQGTTGGYEPEQRGYILRFTARTLAFTIGADSALPVHNLCFVLKRWNSGQDARVIGADHIRQGTVRDTDCSYTKIIYIEKIATEPLDLKILK